MTSTSVPTFKPSNTIRDASHIAPRVVTTAASIPSASPSTRRASCTGAQTWTPRSEARQHASRRISAPLACIGKFRNVVDRTTLSVRNVQTNTVNR